MLGKMRVAAVFLLAILSFTVTFAKVEVEVQDGVLVLTKDTFNSTITENEHVLIEFYAPWCGHCKALAPEYAKAAQKLQELQHNVKLAKVDATVETELAEQHGVRGYPTLKFYRKGTIIDYNAGRQVDDIVNWLIKKTGPGAKDLDSIDAAKAFIDERDIAVVGFFKDAQSEMAKIFYEVANTVDDHDFGISSNADVLSTYEAEDNTVLLFKKFDEGKSKFDGEFNVKNLQKFIAGEALPLVVEFNQDTARKIFSGDIKSHLLVFLSKEAGHLEKYTEELKGPAKKFRGEVLFVTINADIADHDRILEFFGMKADDVPAMRLIKLEEDMAKYKPEKPELSSDNILEFVNAFVEGKLKRHLITQDLPDDWNDKPVKVLVGTNFHKIAHNKENDVLVEFYAPWCGHCQQLVPIYDKLAEKYEKKESLVIAKMDATANELEDITVSSYPTIILYKKGTNEAVRYNGERSLDGLSKFIETDGVYGQAAEEAQEENEDDDVPRRDEL